MNLHRNVFFRGDNAPTLPFSRIMSPNPEDLWAWMDGLRGKGGYNCRAHRYNGFNGLMFLTKKWDGSPMDTDYAETRMHNEPIVETTQVEGVAKPTVLSLMMNLPISKLCPFVSGHGRKRQTALMRAQLSAQPSSGARQVIPIALV